MYKRQRGGALRAMNSSAVSSIVKTLQQLIGFFFGFCSSNQRFLYIFEEKMQQQQGSLLSYSYLV